MHTDTVSDGGRKRVGVEERGCGCESTMYLWLLLWLWVYDEVEGNGKNIVDRQHRKSADVERDTLCAKNIHKQISQPSSKYRQIGYF